MCTTVTVFFFYYFLYLITCLSGQGHNDGLRWPVYWIEWGDWWKDKDKDFSEYYFNLKIKHSGMHNLLLKLKVTRSFSHMFGG